MTHEELQAFQDRYFEILEAKEPMRTNRLTNLMTDLEQCYNIPMMHNPAYASANPEVMNLYQSVSKSRQF